MAALFVASVSSCGPGRMRRFCPARHLRPGRIFAARSTGWWVDGETERRWQARRWRIVGHSSVASACKGRQPRSRPQPETGADGRYRLRIPVRPAAGRGDPSGDDLPSSSYRVATWPGAVMGSFPTVNRATTSPSVQSRGVWRNGSLPCPTTGTWSSWRRVPLSTRQRPGRCSRQDWSLMVLRPATAASARRKAHGPVLGRTRHFAASVEDEVRGATGYAGKFEVGKFG